MPSTADDISIFHVPLLFPVFVVVLSLLVTLSLLSVSHRDAGTDKRIEITEAKDDETKVKSTSTPLYCLFMEVLYRHTV